MKLQVHLSSGASMAACNLVAPRHGGDSGVMAMERAVSTRPPDAGTMSERAENMKTIEI